MSRDDKVRIVFVVSVAILNDPVYQKRLWIAARNMLISRRKWADAIADAIYNFDGVILLQSGMKWPIPKDIDTTLGSDRWFSYYFEANGNGEPRRAVLMLERLRLIDLFFKIKYPTIAEKFNK